MKWRSRMQVSVPELADLSRANHSTCWKNTERSQGDGILCLQLLCWLDDLLNAVCDFIHLYHRGWDHHGGLVKNTWISVAG